MTTLMTAPEQPVRPVRPVPLSTGTRVVAVRANLMPDVVLSARQTDTVRRRVLIGLVGIVAVLIAGYGASWLQTTSARSDLSDLQHRTSALQSQQSSYGPLVNAQAEASAVRTQLQTLMASDLSWHSVLTFLRSSAPTGLTPTNVTGSVTSSFGTAGGAATAIPDPLVSSNEQPAGAVTISGTAGSKSEVAAYSDRLGAATGLTAVLITSVTNATAAGGPRSGVTFTMTATITAAALGGRYSPPAVTPTSTTGGH